MEKKDPEKSNIILIGFMGCGKSSVGRLLAEKLGRRYIDTDLLIETMTGLKVAEIFQSSGEKSFRKYEKEALASLTKYQSGTLVVATGGGAVLDADNRKLLTAGGLVILLRATPEAIVQRVGSAKNRPLLQVADPVAKIKVMLQERAPFYSEHDYAVDTTELTPNEVVTEILKFLRA